LRASIAAVVELEAAGSDDLDWLLAKARELARGFADYVPEPDENT
jgi:hypothetical protein